MKNENFHVKWIFTDSTIINYFILLGNVGNYLQSICNLLSPKNSMTIDEFYKDSVVWEIEALFRYRGWQIIIFWWKYIYMKIESIENEWTTYIKNDRPTIPRPSDRPTDHPINQQFDYNPTRLTRLTIIII